MTTSALPVANAVTDFGADPSGLTPSTTAFQNAINGAWGLQTTGTWVNNRILWIPPGTYLIDAPLAMVNRSGTIMMGAGMMTSILNFQPTTLGNSVTTTGLTPCIAQDGCNLCSFVNFGIVGPSSTPDATITGFDHWKNLTGSNGVTTQNRWENMYFKNLALGIIVDNPPGANCENGIVVNCVFDTCTSAGVRCVGSNTLNWSVLGGVFRNCSANTGVDPFTVTHSSDFGAISVSSGGITNITGVTFENNAIDIVDDGTQGMDIAGGSSTSPIFLVSIDQPISVHGFHYRPTVSHNCDFIDMTWGPYVTVTGCKFDPQSNTGIGFIARGTQLNSAVIYDGLTLGANAGSCSFDGAYELYDRGCNFVPPGGTLNPNLTATFTGTRHSS